MRSKLALIVVSLLLIPLTFLAACSQKAQGDSSRGWWPFSGEPVTVPAGTEIAIRLSTGLSSEKNEGGDTFDGTLEHALVVGDKVVFPAGTDVAGKVTHAIDSGRLKQRAELWVTLTEIDGNPVTTSVSGRKEGSKLTRNLLFIGGGAGGGAAIGGAADGGKGAGIGAAIGAGAGTAAAALTGERDIVFPPETRLRFRLKESLTVEL